MVDHISNSLTLDAFTPRGVMKLGLDLMGQSAGAIRLLAPWPEIRLASLELQNKLETFSLFEHVDSVLRIPKRGDVCFDRLIEQTRTLDSFCAVWATEGVGHYLTEIAWQRDGPPVNLLNSEGRKEIPEGSFAALHAGMGLAFGNRILNAASQKSTALEIRQALEQFVRLCRDNSNTDYIGAAYESLGLVARNMHPYLVAEIDSQLANIGKDLREYFWHGVGRAIYFAPTNAFPDGESQRRALKMAGEEPPHAIGRRNSLAGLAWAMMLVNIRHPQVLENFIKLNGDQLSDTDAFSNGIESAILIWRDSAGESPSLTAFCQFDPGDPDPKVSQCWEQMIRRPCRNALDHYSRLKNERRLGEVFRYIDIRGLAHERANRPRRAGGAWEAT